MTATAPPGHVTGEGSVVGDVLAGFRIVQRLRVRGCGAVYRAVSGSGETVALKTLCVAGPARAQKRMDNEVSALRLLSDMSVVPDLVAHGSTGRQRFLAVRWRPGVTLRRLSRREPVTEATSARFGEVAIAVAGAFGRLHDAGVVHGDVSRFNVLVADSTISLIDLESARHPRYPESLNRKLTWIYAAPELARDTDRPAEPTAASDQYGVAAILYRQLAGRRHRPPAPDVPTGSTAALAVSARPLTGWPSTRWPELPRVFAAALDPSPARRFGSMAAFGDALTDALSGGR